MLSVRIPASLVKRVKKAAIDADQSTQDFVANALTEYLKKRNA